jgi:hypothetical protein
MNKLDIELSIHLLDEIDDLLFHEPNFNIDDLHHHVFNQTPYIIGNNYAKEWLKKHELCAFDVIDIVREYEVDHFGEFITLGNAESIVNMFIYIKGETLVSNIMISNCNTSNLTHFKNELIDHINFLVGKQ